MASTARLVTERLVLTPLVVADAAEMLAVLCDRQLYAFTGGEPPTFDQLEQRYRVQSAGSPNEGETWHNWIIRLDGAAIGFVQATVIGDEADLAWVVGLPWQNHGYATEASTAMRDWLKGRGVEGFSAHVHPKHGVSERVATHLGLRPTGQLDGEGEMIWA